MFAATPDQLGSSAAIHLWLLNCCMLPYCRCCRGPAVSAATQKRQHLQSDTCCTAVCCPTAGAAEDRVCFIATQRAAYEQSDTCCDCCVLPHCRGCRGQIGTCCHPDGQQLSSLYFCCHCRCCRGPGGICSHTYSHRRSRAHAGPAGEAGQAVRG